jgi:hypothetical protein
VREVRVHRDEHVDVVVETPGHAGAVCVTEASLGLAMQHGDVADLAADFLGPCAGAVGTVVVDDQYPAVR